ncbi:MAG: putative secreted protein [Caloramator sp.]|uniref:alkaline phosphatase n=1 Tax=Caloramator sp. TaxID=1871330 RepID=UPI001D84000E|nr:alkaline phosphatase [Caloramator sp.]MBZ4663408.1 putative secreted protein [Caloramator sp.]
MNSKIKKIFCGALCSIVLVGSLVTTGIRNTFNVKAESPRKVKNVIMLIGDGMSTEAITLARWYNNGQPLAMDEISVGAVKTYWVDGPITDSAPGGTAYAVGQKTKNKYVGVSKDKKPLATILEAAKLDGKATGLVVTCEVPHATPADFSAHIDSRSNYDAIIKQQVYNGLDVVLGGGKKYSEVYKDELIAKGYDYVTTKQEMLQATSNKIWGMFADVDMAYDIDREKTRAEEPTLAEMTKKAIEVLSKDKDGFFLMVEGSKIDWAAHANDPVG